MPLLALACSCSLLLAPAYSCPLLLAPACSRLLLLALACSCLLLLAMTSAFRFIARPGLKARGSLFPIFSEVFSSCYFGVVFLSFYVLSRVSREVFYSTLSLKNINLSISEIPLKTWQAQCFRRSRHPGGREKVTKKVVRIRWKN